MCWTEVWDAENFILLSRKPHYRPAAVHGALSGPIYTRKVSSVEMRKGTKMGEGLNDLL